MELRIWVVKLGYIGIVFPLPLTLAAFVVSIIRNIHKPHAGQESGGDNGFGKAFGKGVLTLALAMYVVLGIFLFEIADEEYFQKESYLAPGLIQGADKNSKNISEKIASGEISRRLRWIVVRLKCRHFRQYCNLAIRIFILHLPNPIDI